MCSSIYMQDHILWSRGKIDPTFKNFNFKLGSHSPMVAADILAIIQTFISMKSWVLWGLLHMEALRRGWQTVGDWWSEGSKESGVVGGPLVRSFSLLMGQDLTSGGSLALQVMGDKQAATLQLPVLYLWSTHRSKLFKHPFFDFENICLPKVRVATGQGKVREKSGKFWIIEKVREIYHKLGKF